MKKFLFALLLLVAWTNSVLAYPYVYYREDTSVRGGMLYRHIVEDRLILDSVATFVGGGGKSYIFFKTLRNTLWDEPTVVNGMPWANTHEKNENPEFWLYNAYSGVIHKVGYNLTVNDANVDEIFNNEKYSQNQSSNKVNLLKKGLNDIAQGSKDYNDPKHVELIRKVIKENENSSGGGLIDISSNGPLSKINETADTDIIQVVNDPSPVLRDDDKASQSPVTYSVYNLYKQKYSRVEAALAQYGWKRMPGHWYWHGNHIPKDHRTVLYERISPFDDNVKELLYVGYYFEQHKPNMGLNQTACQFELRLVPEDGSQETVDKLYDQFYDRIKNTCPTMFVFDCHGFVGADDGICCGYDEDGDGYAGIGYSSYNLNCVNLARTNDSVSISTHVSPYMELMDDAYAVLSGPQDRSHPVFESYKDSAGYTLYSENDYPFYAHKVGREEFESGIPVD